MTEKKLNGSINPQSVVIVISTFYPLWYKGKLRSIKHTDKIRGDLVLELVRQTLKRGYKMVVVDGKSAKTFCQVIKNTHDILFLKRKNPKRSPAKRQAIRIALKQKGIKIIVLTEGEKVSLITDCMDFLIREMGKGDVDMIIPKRDPALFASSFPQYMYESEVEGNELYNEELRVNRFLEQGTEDLDMFFGPRIFRNDPKIISLFMKKYKISASHASLDKIFFDAEDYSNTLYFPVILALKKKLRVKSVTVPFVYPKIQKENEEKGERELFLEKRKAQRLAILAELLHFINYLEGIKKVAPRL